MNNVLIKIKSEVYTCIKGVNKLKPIEKVKKGKKTMCEHRKMSNLTPHFAGLTASHSYSCSCMK